MRLSNFVQALAINDSMVFAGTFNGIFRSRDNGENWESASNGLTWTASYVNSLAVQGSSIYAGSQGGGIFYSADNGSNWTEANNGLTNLYIRALAVKGTKIFAGTDDGVFFSTNEDLNWTKVNDGLGNYVVYAFAVIDSSIIAGTSGGGIFVSINDGMTWNQVCNQDDAGTNQLNVTAFTVTNSKIFAGTWNGGILLSQNNGINWTKVNQGSTTCLASQDTLLFAGTFTGQIYISTDDGLNFVKVMEGVKNVYLQTVALAGNNIFVGSLWGAFLLKQNATGWIQINNGLKNLWVQTFAFSGSKIFAGTGGGVFVSIDSGAHWTEANDGLGNRDTRALAVRHSKIFAGTDTGIFVANIDTLNWRRVSNGLPDQPYMYIQSLAASKNNLFAGILGYGVFISYDDGNTWEQCTATAYCGDIRAIAVDDSDIFVGANGYGGVFKSTDEGMNWIQVNNGLYNGFSTYAVSSLVFSGSRIFAGTFNGGIFCSDRNEVKWTKINLGLTTDYINKLAVNDSSIFAATYSGLWRRSLSEIVYPLLTFSPPTVTYGNTLIGTTKKDSIIVKNTGTKALRIDSMKTRTDEFEVMVSNGTTAPFTIGINDSLKFYVNFSPKSAGAKTDTICFYDDAEDSPHKISLSGNGNTTRVKTEGNGIPREFSLSQNYPNPFNPNTTIQFSLPKTARVALKIYNTLGQEVVQLVSQQMNAGIYTVEWNASCFASGVYYYKLEAGSFTETKKLVLLR